MTGPKENTIAIISSDLKSQKIIHDELKNTSINLIVFDNIIDILKHNLNYVGFVIEIKTLIKSSLEERQIINNLENTMCYPLLRTTIKENNVHGVLTTTQVFQTNNHVENFKELCIKESGRRIRKKTRKNVFISLLWKSYDDNSDWEKSFSANISEGGLFIINIENTSIKIGNEVFLKFGDDSPVFSARICWKIDWGNLSNHPLGFGVEIINSKEDFSNFYKNSYTQFKQ